MSHNAIYTYVHMYICIYAVELLTGPSSGVFKVISWAKLKLLTGPRSFSHYKIGVLGDLLLLSYHCVFFAGAQLSGNFLKIALFSKQGCKTLGSFV